MPNFNIPIRIFVDGADKIDKATDATDALATSAKGATDALKGAGAAGKEAAEGLGATGGAAKGAADDFTGLVASYERQQAMLQRIKEPWKEYQEDLKAAAVLVQAGKLSTGEYEAELGRLQARQEQILSYNMAPSLKREADMLERIQGPLRQYQEQLKALDGLLAKEQISLEVYNRELERVQKTAERAGAIGPVQGPKQQTPGAPAAPESDTTGDVFRAVAPQLGQGGQLLSQFASGGAIATAAVAALGAEFVHLGDEYIVLANKAQKVTDTGGNINETLNQQLELSKQLHGSLTATIELYDSVRDGTDELNMSQGQQVQLAREIGQAVLAEGKSIESAEGLMRRLTYAFASGAITGRDLKSIMKEFPDIGAAFVETMGHSRKELVDMANKGMISSDMLISAFHSMSKEMAEKVDKQIETTGQKWQHFKDEIVLGAGSIGGAISTAFGATLDAYRGAGHALGDFVVNSFTDENEEKKLAALQRITHEYRAQLEGLKQLSGEEEKNAKTAEIANAAKRVGVEFAPFDEAQANKAAAMRIEQRQLGIETADAFEAAHAKAQLFGSKLAEIQERKDAEKIAEDVKRIYNEMHGVDDIMDSHFKRWQDMADQISVVTKAIERWKTLTPAGVPTSQEQRDLELQRKNLQTDQADSQYGKGMVTYAQGLNTARAELDRLNAAHDAGVIKGEAFRQKYEALMATLNNGRLPETIKLWDEFHLPQEQFMRDQAALNVLLATGGATLGQYTVKLHELEDAFDKSGVLKMIRENSEAFALAVQGPKRTQASDFAAYQADVTHESAIDTKVADTERGYKIANMEGPSLERDIEAWNKRITAVNENMKALDPLEYAMRQHALMLEEEKKILEQVNGAPIKDYKLGIEAANDLLARGKINAEQHAQAINANRLAYLQATPAAKTFAGAMEIDWIKMQQEADSFGATVANLAVADFGKLNDAIVTAANGGAVSWGQMADSMIQDLERIALKMAEVKLIQAGMNLLGSAGGGGGGMDAGLVDEFATGMGYANGGSFRVGGQGGTDSKYIGMRVTPGEVITVSTPGQQGEAGRAQRQATAVVVQPQIHNHYDDSMGVRAIGSAAGQTAILNVLRANAPAIRAALGRG